MEGGKNPNVEGEMKGKSRGLDFCFKNIMNPVDRGKM